MLQGNIWLEITCLGAAFVAGFFLGLLVLSIMVCGGNDDKRMGRK